MKNYQKLQHVLDENFQVLKNNTEDVKNFVKSKFKNFQMLQIMQLKNEK